jgi:multicomponent Na+:H+ antiporter subunit E
MPSSARTQVLWIACRRALLLAAVWLTLSAGEGASLAGWLVAALAVAAATALSLRLMPARPPAVRLGTLARMAPGFLWRSVLGGIDVARRALDPRLPLRPGWVVLPTALPPGGERVALGGEFSLLPGTLVAGTRAGNLLVHCLDRDQPIEAEVEQAEREVAASAGHALADPAPETGDETAVDPEGNPTTDRAAGRFAAQSGADAQPPSSRAPPGADEPDDRPDRAGPVPPHGADRGPGGRP